MIVLLIIVTLVAMFIPVYVYLGYPALLVVLDKLVKGKTIQTADIRPTVSLIVSCYNEADVIEQKIINCLAIDYPQNLLEILFVSDGSDDETDQLIKRLSNRINCSVSTDNRMQFAFYAFNK